MLELRTSNKLLPYANAPSRNGIKFLEVIQAGWAIVNDDLVYSETVSIRRVSYPSERSRNQSERLNLTHMTMVSRTPLRMLLSCLWLLFYLLLMLLPFKMSPSFLIKKSTFCQRKALIPSLFLKLETVFSFLSPSNSQVSNNTGWDSSETFFSMGHSPGSLHLSKLTAFDTSGELKFDWNLLSGSRFIGA